MRRNRQISSIPLKVTKIFFNIARICWFPNVIRQVRFVYLRFQYDRLVVKLTTTSAPQQFDGKVLVDAQWDNPNWWFRCRLFLSAIGASENKQVAFLGDHNNSLVRLTLKSLSLEAIRLRAFMRPKIEYETPVNKLLETIHCGKDLIKAQFPMNIPGSVVFDWILKRQRNATVNIKHPDFRDDMILALRKIDAASRMVLRVDPDLVVISHAVGVESVALIAAAIRKKARVVVGYAEYGLLRYWKIESIDDISYKTQVPGLEEINSLAAPDRNRLAASGVNFIKRRMLGEADDLGARYAFSSAPSLSRRDIHDYFQWQDDRPMISVYSNSWFDYPHCYGDMEFRDPLDWIETTIRAIRKNKSVHWILRPHPCDDWYKSLSLAELVPSDLPQHIGLAPTGWSGLSVFNASDGLVTLYGTAGIEYAALGKPVLVGTRSWYGALGFVTVPSDKNDYISRLLEDRWYRPITDKMQESAKIFAGWHYCSPFANGIVLADDSLQDKIYSTFSDHAPADRETIDFESHLINRWWLQGKVKSYHNFKVLESRAVA